MTKNIHYVNNTLNNIEPIMQYFIDAYQTGELHEDVADLFSIKILKEFNADGSDRMMIFSA